jgi:hypothetical protein
VTDELPSISAYEDFRCARSADEELPWGGRRLIIGTGAYGSLPIMPEVMAEAARRSIDLVAVPTDQACRLIAGLNRREVRAVLHVTC